MEHKRTITDDELIISEYAQLIKSEYINQKSAQRLGKKYNLSQRYSDMDLWRKAAVDCLELKSTPELWVSAAMTLYGSIPGAPYPNQLYGNSFKSKFKMYLEQNGIKLDHAVVDISKKVQDTIKLYCLYSYKRAGNKTEKEDREIYFLEDFGEDKNPWASIIACPTPAVKSKYMAKALDAISKNPYLRDALERLDHLKHFDEIDD